jgi:MFS family permease
MKSFSDALQSIAVTLWVGGMWVAGFVVAPLLFSRLPDRALAGMLAGRLFAIIAFIGIACAAYLLIYRLMRYGAAGFRQGFFWVVLLMLVLILVGEFGVQPILESLKAQALPKEVMASVFRKRFDTWHGVASGLYVIESLLGIALVVLQNRAR